MFKRLIGAAAISLLLSCSSPNKELGRPGESLPGRPVVDEPPRAGEVPAANGAPAAGEATAGGVLPAPGGYRIDPSGSELRMLVYRSGVLANLGHNHVIVNRSVTGSIEVARTLNASTLSLRVPVAAFNVDDIQARAEEGEDFPGEISDESKTSTYNNMTGLALLNSTQYPVVSLHSVKIEQSRGEMLATISLNVAGRDSTITVPFSLSKEAYGLSATASFSLRQSELGLTPFSIMLGALAVRDEMHVKLRVAAQLEAPRP